MEERLRKFAALVDGGTFTVAARELHVSQPALSTAVAKLERELHAKLLVRGVRQLTLTDAGRIAYETAKTIAVSTDNLDLRLRELAHAELEMSVGMIDSVAATVFAHPETFSALERRARVSVVVDNSRALLSTVERGELDLALVVDAVNRPKGMVVSHAVAHEPLVLVTQEAHTPALAAALAQNKLPDLISYDQASTTCRIVLEALLQQGIAPSVHFYSTSPEVMLRLVLMGRGAAVLPYLLVRDQLNAGTLALLPLKQASFISRPIAAMQRRDKVLPAPLKQLTLALRRELQALAAEATARASQTPSAHN